ncbi:MAG TPA: DUF1592 domain-containing protein [Humisphaera sp.]
MGVRPITLVLFAALVAAPFAPAARAADAGARGAFVSRHCVSCHDGDTREGGLDLTVLPAALTDDPVAAAAWAKVFDRVAAGEMPPKKKSKPPADESAGFLSGLDADLVAADAARAARDGRAVLRRLTRGEYENALRDLLDLPDLQVRDLLPADGTRHGFDKVGDALDLSHVQLAKYLEAADRALDAAICPQPNPPPVLKRRVYPASSFKFMQALGSGNGVLLKDGKPDPLWPPPGKQEGETYGQGIKAAYAAGVNKSPSAVAVFHPAIEGWYTSTLFAPVHRGTYRLRFSTWSLWWDAGRVAPAPRTETATLISGPSPTGTFRTLGYFDAPSLAPREHELTVRLGPGDEVIFDPASLFWHGLQVRQHKGGAAEHVGPAVAIDWFEAEGPTYDQWPPASHRRLFGDLPIAPFDPKSGLTPPAHPKPTQPRGYGWPEPISLAGQKYELHTVASARPLDDARRLLAAFLPRAFRRDVAGVEVERYVGLVKARLDANDCFELAMRHAYKAALTSTSFLVRREAPGPLDGPALATRLSLWLWNSVPDDELMDLGRRGKLTDPAVLRAQVDRLLADRRSDRFVADFLDQWLNLRDIDATDPDRRLYPEFDRYLKESMLAESRAFLRELIDRDEPATGVLASDWAMLNQRLAEHYGIPGVTGSAIRRVSLAKDCPRGGFLTQGSVLKVTANGTVTSPVVRGVFVTERLLGVPVPPPPPGVPAIDPDTRGATTAREQLERHRADAACASCHRKMDPPGLALESFDVIGGWRERYRSVGKGAPSAFRFPDGRGVTYKDGPPVDPSGQTPDGEPFADVAGFRRLALARPERVARALAAQMLTYATGAEPTYADRRAIDRIVAETAGSRYGVRSLVHAIAQSPTFRNK